MPVASASASSWASAVSAAAFHVPVTAMPEMPLSVIASVALPEVFQPVTASAPDPAMRQRSVAVTVEDPFGGPAPAILTAPVVVTRGSTVGADNDAAPYPNPELGVA